MSEHIHDVLIVGGGLVGASLACALDGSGLDVALVEAEPANVPMIADADARSLGLAAASLNALRALGVLQHLPIPPEPIRRIHVTRRGNFGAVRLHAADYGRPEFGGVVPAPALGAALRRRVGELHGLHHLTDAKLVALRAGEGAREANIVRGDATTLLRARLVVGADGTGSVVRAALGIPTRAHDYHQHLFAGSVRATHASDGHAWERFTESGPVALLPRAGGDYGCICTVADEDEQAVAALDDAGFMAQLQQRFGWRAGRFVHVGRRSGHPLRQLVAEHLVAARGVVMGNAAQTLHPVGAQGFNLGLRDALTLAELLCEARADGRDPGAESLLAMYAARRAEDRAQTLRFSDGLARLTANPSLSLGLLRTLAMGVLEHVPEWRARLAGGAMGFRGHVPGLARDASARAGGAP